MVTDIEEAMRFIERNTRTAYRIEGLRRQNVPEYPMEGGKPLLKSPTKSLLKSPRKSPRN